MNNANIVCFEAGSNGDWIIDRIDAVAGVGLGTAAALSVNKGLPQPFVEGAWLLRGVISNVRYTNRDEAQSLRERQEPLDRTAATRAALIPIRKSETWWSMAQDERRSIFEAQSRHIGIGMEYLPAVARRLHHSRDLGEPFDFLTWFEYAPEHADLFETMLKRLRETTEWKYVDREVDIRMHRA